MKKILSIRVLLTAILMLTAAAATAREAPHKLKGVSGSAQGEAVFMPDVACMGMNAYGVQTRSFSEGWISKLGWVVMEGRHCPPDDPTTPFTGHATFTCLKSGDTLDASYTVRTVVLAPAVVQESTFYIYNGTGRFEGATGKLATDVFVTPVFIGDGPEMDLTAPWPLKFNFNGYVND